MQIASRFDDKYKMEKCPICLTIGQNFLIIGNPDERFFMFMCFKCGNVFVPKCVRNKIDIKGILLAQQNKLRCGCGKVCKTKTALINHQNGSKCPLNVGGEGD